MRHCIARIKFGNRLCLREIDNDKLFCKLHQHGEDKEDIELVFCEAKFKKGEKRGQVCLRRVRDKGETYCRQHRKYTEEPTSSFVNEKRYCQANFKSKGSKKERDKCVYEKLQMEIPIVLHIFFYKEKKI